VALPPAELPAGTVTFLFTDIEGSTRLLEERGERYGDLLGEHRRVLREAFARHGGVEVDTQGDAFFVAFSSAAAALAAAEEAQAALELPVRMGIHTGEPQLTAEGYVGMDVHCAARICSAAHGGQVVVSQTTRDLVAADVRDVGVHRLKDIGELRLYQLGDGEFPPLRSLNQTNLPIPAEPLVGRKKELADVLRLVRVDGARIVTITGPGGIGKTRFALELAMELVEDFRDGVWFVDLSTLRDPELVLPSVGSTVGARVDLIGHLADKELLLVLDTLDQVVEAAPALASLLERCPYLYLLVTSREPLHVRGEREYALRPLAESPAVALFRQRAQALDPDFDAPHEQLVAVCRRLDNLPLALELAAARTRTLTLQQLLERLEERLPLLAGRQRDVPERQRTLRATIEWGYDLLEPHEQDVFRRLSVFAGGFTLDAAEEVVGADLDSLESLLEKSLVKRNEDRLSLLDTVREFATELLERNSESDHFRHRHAKRALRIASELEERRRSPEANAALAELDSEEDNLRAALEWLLDAKPEDGLQLAVDLSGYWWVRDRLRESDYWLTKALRRGSSAQPVLRAKALHTAGDNARVVGDEPRATRLFEQALSIARRAGAKREIAGALVNLGRAEEGLALYREVGWEPGVAVTLHFLADAARDRGDFAHARSLYSESIARWRRLGLEWGLGNVLHALGDCALDEGEVDEAAQVYGEALALGLDGPSELFVAYCVAGLSAVAAARGRHDVAARLWGAVESIERAHEVELARPERNRYERFVEPISPTLQPLVEEGRRLGLATAAAYATESIVD
jgi:predicted ATPase